MLHDTCARSTRAGACAAHSEGASSKVWSAETGAVSLQPTSDVDDLVCRGVGVVGGCVGVGGDTEATQVQTRDATPQHTLAHIHPTNTP